MTTNTQTREDFFAEIPDGMLFGPPTPTADAGATASEWLPRTGRTMTTDTHCTHSPVRPTRAHDRRHTEDACNACIPVLDALRDGVHLVAWCDHCKREHSHGVCSGDPDCPTMRSYGRKACTCSPGSRDGHRVAHCPDEASPYYRTGYVLREIAAIETIPTTRGTQR